MSWSLILSTHPSGKTYARPLSIGESTYYFHRIFDGTGDLLWKYDLEESCHLNGTPLFSEANVARAWAAVKQWYPLLGARVDDSAGIDALRFVVSERALSHHSPGEVTFGTASSGKEVDAVVWSMLRNDKLTENNHLLSRLFVFSRTDTPGTHHVVFRISHINADGLSGPTIARTLFDVLTSPAASMPIPSLEERFALALSYDQLNPTLTLSPAHQRWRRAAARVIFLNRRRKLVGGHTIPRTATEKSYRTPAVTGQADHWFSPAESAAILAACKMYRVTMGTVIPVVCQIALARMLLRRYLRGDLSEAEWEHRRRQPMHYTGPVNLRPRMLAGESGAAVMLAIDFYECTLPFMPTGAYSGTRAHQDRNESDGVFRDGAPGWGALLSPARFFYRARLFREQLRRVLTSPLMLDIALERQRSYLANSKRSALHWLAEQRDEDALPEVVVPECFDNVPADYVPSNNLSSMGQMTFVLPDHYPLPLGHPLSVRTSRASTDKVLDGTEKEDTHSSHLVQVASPAVETAASEDAVLRIVDRMSFLRGAPLEFFLGNGTERGRIGLVSSFDTNVYRKEDAEEFVGECRDATLYYLAGAHAAGDRVHVKL